MPSLLFLVDIDIQPYLIKYLLYQSVNKDFPLRFPNAHYYNLLLIKLITNYNSLTSIPINDKQNVIDYFKPSRLKGANNVSIILPFNRLKDIRSYNYISLKNKALFRKEVKLDFNHDFSRALLKGIREGKPRTEIINSFMQMYNITEDDLKTESLYRFSSRLLYEK